MALDIYWQEGRGKTRIGQMEVDDAFDKLIFQYERQSGIHVDLYGHSRLYASQWQQLIVLAHQTNFDAVQLEAVQAKLPADASKVILNFTLRGVAFRRQDARPRWNVAAQPAGGVKVDAPAVVLSSLFTINPCGRWVHRPKWECKAGYLRQSARLDR